MALLPARRNDMRSDKFSSQGGLRGLLSLDLPASRASNMAFKDLANRRPRVGTSPNTQVSEIAKLGRHGSIRPAGLDCAILSEVEWAPAHFRPY